MTPVTIHELELVSGGSRGHSSSSVNVLSGFNFAVLVAPQINVSVLSYKVSQSNTAGIGQGIFG